MSYALNLADDGRILSATFEQYAAADMPIVNELPPGNIADYRRVSGEYVYDPLPAPSEPNEPDAPTLEERVETVEQDTATLSEAVNILMGGGESA